MENKIETGEKKEGKEQLDKRVVIKKEAARNDGEIHYKFVLKVWKMK